MTRAPSICIEPRCYDKAPAGQSRCPEHEAEKRRERDRRRVRPPGYDAKWRRTSRAYLAAHPRCERCQDANSHHVHHRDGRGPTGPLGHIPSNLEALCRSCHGRETATFGGGYGNPRRAREQ